MSQKSHLNIVRSAEKNPFGDISRNTGHSSETIKEQQLGNNIIPPKKAHHPELEPKSPHQKEVDELAKRAFGDDGVRQHRNPNTVNISGKPTGKTHSH